jgi:hypothetical protein
MDFNRPSKQHSLYSTKIPEALAAGEGGIRTLETLLTPTRFTIKNFAYKFLVVDEKI